MAHTKEHEAFQRKYGDRDDRIVGAYKTKASERRPNKLEGGVESFDGGDFTLGSKKNISKRRQRALDKDARKDARRKRRAERIADRKLMSTEQAQEFMRNRKDRFNTAFGNVLLDLTGNEDKKGVIKDRYYRKEGGGTIQNVAKLDKDGKPTGETYDARDPFQFSRTRVTPEYDFSIKPKPMEDLTIKIDQPKINIDPIKVQKKIVERKKEDEIEKIVNPPAGPPTKIEIPDVVPTGTVNPTTSESIRAGNKMRNSNLLGPTDKITDGKRYLRPGGTGTIFSRFVDFITPEISTRKKGRTRRR